MELIEIVRGMSVNEYCDFVESRALHLRVSSFELNMEYYFECGLISDSMYERAKAELNHRDIVERLCLELESSCPERG